MRQFKNIFLVVILTITLLGCSSDDDKPIDPGPVVENILNGDLKIESQEELEVFFGKEQYTKINGSLFLSGVTDLSLLQNITSIKGLHIGFWEKDEVGRTKYFNNKELKNLKGLENLQEVDGDLSIVFNSLLDNVDEISKLESVNGNLVIGSPNTTFDEYGPYLPYDLKNVSLRNIDGLQKLKSVKGDVLINFNLELVNINGLKNLTKIEGDLIISNNRQLIDIEGLRGVTTIEGDLAIGVPHFPGLGPDTSGSGNPKLITLSSLVKLSAIGGSLYITDNNNLEDIGLDGVLSIGKTIKIAGNANITNLNFLKNFSEIKGDLIFGNNEQFSNFDGFKNITKIAGSLRIGVLRFKTFGTFFYLGNPHLVNLEPFNELEYIGEDLNIYGNYNLKYIGFKNLTMLKDLTINENDELIGFTGFPNLTKFRWLDIINNGSLTNLDGLENLKTLEVITIEKNMTLTDFCGLRDVVFGQGYNVWNNEYNPTEEQLRTDECKM